MKKLMMELRRHMALSIDPSIADAIEYYRAGWGFSVEDANEWFDDCERLDRELEELKEETKKLKEELDAQRKVDDYYHTVDGIVSLVNDHLCDGLRAVNVTNCSDSIELFDAVGHFCSNLRMELDSCEMLKTYQDYHSVMWGRRVRRGCGTMFAIAQKYNLKLLGAFARIWRKGHPDQRQKDVMTPAEVAEWNKLPKKYKDLVNGAVKMKAEVM